MILGICSTSAAVLVEYCALSSFDRQFTSIQAFKPDQGYCHMAGSLDREPNIKLKYAHFKDHLFHSLLVPSVKRPSVQTTKHCLLQCLKNRGCLSTNVGAFSRPDGNVTCELLTTDKYNASEKFQANHSFHHYSIMSPCESFPCKNGASCRAIYETDEYSCSCTPSFTERNCEICNASSCKEMFDKCRGTFEDGNKAYPLMTDAGLQFVYCHFSDLGDCGPGPWTMVMKLNGTENTFTFWSPFWADKNIFNLEGGRTGLDYQETKLATYSSSPFTQVCLGTKFENENRFIVVNKTADSLYSLIADDIPRPTSLGRDAWKKLFGDSGSLELYCNNEGFNAGCPMPQLRIGIITNEVDLCTQCGGWIGFGSGPSACMQRATARSDNGAGLLYAMGYIMVK